MMALADAGISRLAMAVVPEQIALDAVEHGAIFCSQTAFIGSQEIKLHRLRSATGGCYWTGEFMSILLNRAVRLGH